MSAPRIGALFAGYGGLDLAVTQVYGGDMAWYSEIDKGALKVLAHRFPDVPNVGSVTEADWSSVEPVDILTGGSPCQDLSHAGRRAGMTEGTRSNLWVAMREAIAQLRPAVAVWENVRGAYSAEADSALEFCAGCMGDAWYRGAALRALGRVLGDLSELGYDARWHGLRAADVGAPHGRFRVFVVAADARGAGAWRNGRAVPSSVGQVGRSGVDVPAALDGDLLPTPRSSDTNGAGAHGEGGVDLRTAVALMPTPTTRDDKGHNQRRDATCLTGALMPTPRATDGTKGGPGQRGSSGDLMLPSAVALLPTPRVQNNENRQSDANGGENGNFYGLLNNPERWGDYAPAIARWEAALGRPAPAPTMTSTKGNPQLSPVFVEWLMGLPAGWVTDVPGLTRNEALKALGNGVVPAQAAEALRVMASWAVAA